VALLKFLTVDVGTGVNWILNWILNWNGETDCLKVNLRHVCLSRDRKTLLGDDAERVAGCG
jgi:hypothetical protein